ncbi:hypothetical protein EDB84DRAFT_517557 [Lactarius hengduanensis]|nr:hypothetical protein EDB84DRAFT_615135 [Lactarius hengduanensis]KAH9021932.1 hypothetical protein EDB84DRAFT_517557 [Lactarius hengduanensis]
MHTHTFTHTQQMNARISCLTLWIPCLLAHINLHIVCLVYILMGHQQRVHSKPAASTLWRKLAPEWKDRASCPYDHLLHDLPLPEWSLKRTVSVSILVCCVNSRPPSPLNA